jgi:hypothetical protein
MHSMFSLVVITLAITAAGQAPRQLPQFQSIEVSGGGHVLLRNAPSHDVRVVKGSRDLSRIEVTRSGTLIIDKCRTKCPKGYRLEVEVFAPNIRSISVAHGGRIESSEGFSRRAELTLDVSNGGTIDVRSLSADRVIASVNQGGGILTSPRAFLSATVANGGNITYWGDPQVKESVDHAGAVQRAAN